MGFELTDELLAQMEQVATNALQPNQRQGVMYRPEVAMALIEAAREALRLREANSWIPVEEGLPNPTGLPVLAVMRDIKGNYCTVIACYYAKQWFKNGVNITPRITRWRPLPAPPQSEKITDEKQEG